MTFVTEHFKSGEEKQFCILPIEFLEWILIWMRCVSNEAAYIR